MTFAPNLSFRRSLLYPLLGTSTLTLPYPLSFEHEARVLINAASVLGSSLRELDPDFITCFSYENSSSPAQASRVAEFLMPTTESATLLAQTLLAKAHADGRVEANHSDGWELISDRLQQKVDEIDRDQC